MTIDKLYHPTETESRLYHMWEESGALGANPDAGRKPYTIMMPPPNVTGSLHVGHALVMSIQDILIRWQRMKGRDTLWLPGTDHAGIATQMMVERKLAREGRERREIGREAFLKEVWTWKEESGGTITRQLRRLGASPDWSRERFTMDEGLCKAVNTAFARLYRDGLIDRAERLVNWDPKLLTAVSDLEVDMKETQGHLWHLRYPVAGMPGRFIVVATTRPETMLGDTAVAVHPQDERYKDLIGKQVRLPLTDRLIPIVGDEHADPTVGSGAVKITPAHDFNDFAVGKRHNLPLITILDQRAHLLNDKHVPEAYRGLDRFVARERIVADLQALELVEKIEPHTHAVPHGERSGVVIEPRLTTQWYCYVDRPGGADGKSMAQRGIEAVEQGRIRIVPENLTNTYFHWLRNIQPWCISRQLWWGHRIPAWYGPDGAIFVAEDEDDAQTQAQKHYGAGKPVTLRQDEDVLDTWFSAGLWPFSTLGWPESTPDMKTYYPTDVLVTGNDIIFFWVARMIMMGLHLTGEVPFHTVFMHGLVRDGHGHKMSKTRGNVVDPLELIDAYGADALRFCLASQCTPGRDPRVSGPQVETMRNFATKLWNAARYCRMHECRPVASFLPEQVSETTNRWIIGEVALLAQRVDDSLEAFRFDDAATALYQFIWGTFCDWYLEFTKPRLTGENEAARAECRATVAFVLDKVLHLLHPFMPFLTEEIWANLTDGKGGALITAPWVKLPVDLADDMVSRDMDWVIRLISAIRTVRSELNVPPKAHISLLVKDAGADSNRRLMLHQENIRRMARISVIRSVLEAPQGTVTMPLDEATLILPLADVIDLEQERQRLTKEIRHLSDELERIAAKLANPQFVERAPEEIVNEQRARQAETVAALERLQSAHQRLSG
ncbi:MAG: valine--tRNA ligase [Alphaproteobacteria bacterium]|nr:MAG: valine--tRNA ligase [Alphaproteobacteria bacterium]